MKMNVADEVSSLVIAYKRTKEERKHLRRTDRIINQMLRRAGNAKEIITHPSRVRWVAVNKEAFEELLNDIHRLTERIHELVGDYREKRIHEATAKIYREMVLVRDDVKDFKNMLKAATSLINISKGGSHTKVACYNENDLTFRDLLRLKEVNRISDEVKLKIEDDTDFSVESELKGLVSVRQYNVITLNDHFTCTEPEDKSGSSQPYRPRGTLVMDGLDVEVWLEWKRVENITKGSLQDKESKLRTAILAEMLHSSKPPYLYVPNCVGYIDDFERNNRYGWIFMMPVGLVNSTVLKTLHSILGQDYYKPTLAQRVSLAWKLASSLLYLYAVNQLHKGVHSGNVIFPFDGDTFNVEKPVLSGFDYSRPESNKTTSRSPDPKWDSYRWPGIQNEAPKATNSRKTYDIYSLGLVLLEIAHQKPLHEIMYLKAWPAPPAQNSSIRTWLLGEKRYPPFKKNPLSELRNIAGDKYWKAVSRCLITHGEMGICVQEEHNEIYSPEIGI